MMKKLLSILMLWAIVAFTSCQKDETSLKGKEVVVNILASMPGTALTRVGSADGGIINWVPNTKLRYTLQVFDGTTVVPTIGDNARIVIYKTAEESAISKTLNFEGVRLLSGKTYDFVIWADFVNDDGSELHYSTLEGLDKISQIGERKGNTESRDAYFGVRSIKVDVASSQEMILRRPFGKMRVITTDIKDIHLAIDESTAVKIKYNSTLPTGFNALKGETMGSEIPDEYEGTISEINADAGTATLSFDYIFADNNPIQTGVNFEVSCLGASYKFESNLINIERNKLTTVKGNILAKSTNVNITIQDEFSESIDTHFADAATVSQMQAVLNVASTTDGAAAIKLTTLLKENADLTVPQAAVNTNTPSIILDLSAGIESGKTLSIKDETEGINDYNGTVHITVPESSQASIVINLSKATVYVNGALKSVTATTAENTLIIEKDAIIDILRVTKGNVDNRGVIKDIVIAVGKNNKVKINNYGSIIGGIRVESGSYELTATAKTAEELRAALVNPNLTGVILTADVKWESANPGNGAGDNQDAFKIGINDAADYYDSRPMDGFVFDGNNHTITGVAYNNLLAVYAHNVTIKNVVLEQTASQKLTRANNGLSIYRSKNIKINNVTIKNTGKAGLVINAATAIATNLHTSGNAWGGVDITKGINPPGGKTPEFTFDKESTFGEDPQVYVSISNTGNDYIVNAPSGWVSGLKYYPATNTVAFVYSSTPFTPVAFAPNGTIGVDKNIPSETGKVVLINNNIFTVGTNVHSSITTAINSIDENGTILVGAGEYEEDFTINKVGITLKGIKEKTILKGYIVVDATGNKSTLSSFKQDWTIREDEASSYGVLVNAQDVTIENVIFNANKSKTSHYGILNNGKNFSLNQCDFYTYWKGVHTTNSENFTITNSKFNMTPFSITLRSIENMNLIIQNNQIPTSSRFGSGHIHFDIRYISQVQGNPSTWPQLLKDNINRIYSGNNSWTGYLSKTIRLQNTPISNGSSTDYYITGTIN